MLNAPKTSDRPSQIHRAVLRAVLEQRLPPGTKLSEDQLGSVFGASRTLVRAALQALAHDGIVTIARHRGAFVASPSVRDAREVFEARRMVESVIIERAAQHFTREHERAVRLTLDEGLQALAAGDRARAIRLSGEFHLAIADAADQSVLKAFLSDLMSRSSLVIALYGHSNHSSCGQEDHRALLAALMRHDVEEARRLMQEHLMHIEADLDFARHEQGGLTLADVLLQDGADTTLDQGSSWVTTTNV